MPRVRITLSFKLFLAVLAMVMLVVLAMVGAAQVSFTRGFVGYLNEQGVTRMDEVMPRVVAAYRAHGSWEFMRDAPSEWFPLLMPRPGEGPPPGPPPPRDATRRPLPPIAGAAVAGPAPGSAPRARAGPPPGSASGAAARAQTPPPGPQVADLTGASLRLALLDADGRGLAGYPDPGADAIRQPVVVDGRRVGWLAMAPFQSVSAAGGERFSAAQRDASLAMGGLALLLAAGIALWFGRVLLAPLRRVADATHSLAAGAYATRVAVASNDEVGQLAADFNRLAQALARTERMRRDFIADISHELRTPLGVLHGELEAVEDGVRAFDRATLASLQSEVRTLNQLVSDLYDLSLSDAGALAYRKADVDVAELLQSTLDRLRERFAARGLALDLALPRQPAIVFGDDRRLQQLFDNLCENALRYTDAGGALRIEAGVNAGHVAIDFADTAPGVPADALQRLFERFYRVEGSRNRAHGGAGLGLAICRNIVLAHDGTIAASASPLGGLRIVVRLPLANRPALPR